MIEEMYHGTSWYEWFRDSERGGLHVTKKMKTALSYAYHTLESSYDEDITDEDIIQLMESPMIIIISSDQFKKNKHWTFSPDGVCDGDEWHETLYNCGMFIIDNFSSSDKKDVKILMHEDARPSLLRLFGRIPKNMEFIDLN